MSTAAPNANLRIALVAAAIAIGMVGLAYASVPLYRIFCQVTGFGGTTQKAEMLPSAAQVRAAHGRQIKVRFDGNVRGLPWQFSPAAPVTVKIGEQNIIFYKAVNQSAASTTGSATFNVSPDSAGKYFSKIQCFCFNEQTLAAGQTADMPVVFFVDPAILDDPDARDIDEITLSYTFYPVAEPSRPPAIRATGEQQIQAKVS
ncbi:cytochrome c oxidase assembly protein [Sandaracinobacteroides hominis]|uniref:cytochrome c oxidase assembly protein n=1 Tax=Sandaracinobacteroides hominis TaxID=2780086 RepID=UPI0018F73023|nr:cytochrome c oxidase assembly protein [Sandaracinobacteroides hominis]